jgi:hypothetical protein
MAEAAASNRFMKAKETSTLSADVSSDHQRGKATDQSAGAPPAGAPFSTSLAFTASSISV